MSKHEWQMLPRTDQRSLERALAPNRHSSRHVAWKCSRCKAILELQILEEPSGEERAPIMMRGTESGSWVQYGTCDEHVVRGVMES